VNRARGDAASGPHGGGERHVRHAPSSRAVAILPARQEDVVAVAALAAEALTEAWSEGGFARTLDADGVVFLVARASAAAPLAGFLLAQRVLDELHVLSLAVAPAWRRTGVASALLDAAAGEPPPPRVLLEVRRSNASARAFYAALHFEEVGERKRYYPDGEDALLLTREADRVAARRRR
jgi:ribosomal-protein-alanine N-acetyltransferase